MSFLHVATADIVIAVVAFVAGWLFGQKVKEYLFNKVSGLFK